MSAWVQVVDTQIKSICEPDWPELGGDTMRHNTNQTHKNLRVRFTSDIAHQTPRKDRR
jgi:hypothetical protein